MDYTSIREEELPDDAKNSTLNLFYACIDAHIQTLIYGCPVYIAQNILRFQ